MKERIEAQSPNQSNLLENYPQNPLEKSYSIRGIQDSQIFNSSDLLQYENVQEQQQKNIIGLWKIEGVDQFKGGRLEWKQRIRLKNIKTGLYLAVFNESQNIISSQDPMAKDKFQVVLQESGDENTLFVLVRIGDVVEKYIEANSCFYIKHEITQQFIASQKSGGNRYEIQTLLKPILLDKGYIANIFHFQKAQKLEEWEIFFLLSCLPLIKYGIDVLKRINNKTLNMKNSSTYQTGEISLLIMKDCLVEIHNFCQDDSENGSEDIEIDKRVRYQRQIILREQGYIKYITMILQQTTHCIQAAPNISDKIISKQNIPQNDKLKRQTKFIGFNQLIKKPELLQRVIKLQSEDKDQSFRILLIVIAQTCYDLLKNICKDNPQNKVECFKYFGVFQEHIGMEVGAESCIISILLNNEMLLIKLHTIDLAKPVNLEDLEFDHEYGHQKILEDVSKSQDLSLNPRKKIQRNLYLEKIQGKTLVHCFVKQYTQKLQSSEQFFYHVELMEFFNSITHDPQTKLGITINQLLIIDLLLLEDTQNNKETSTNIPKVKVSNGIQTLIIPLTTVDGQLMVELEDMFGGEKHQFELAHAFKIIDSVEFKVKDHFETFLQLQLMLFGNLCYGRNYFSKKIVKKKFSCKLLLQYLESKNDKNSNNILLPPNIRAALLYILMCTHLDSKPRKQRIVPNLTHQMDFNQVKQGSQLQDLPQKSNNAFDQIKSMLKIGEKTLDRNKKQNQLYVKQKSKDQVRNSFSGSTRQDMVDEFLDDEDTISLNEMQQLKQYVLKYIQEEMYETINIHNSKAIGQKKKIKYNFLTLQVVIVIHKLLEYDCYEFEQPDQIKSQQVVTHSRVKDTALEFWEETYTKQNSFNLLIIHSIKILEDEDEFSVYTGQAHKSIILNPTDSTNKKRAKENQNQEQDHDDFQNVIQKFFDEELRNRKKRLKTEKSQEFKIDNLISNSHLILKKNYFRLLEEQDRVNFSKTDQNEKTKIMHNKINLQYEVDVKKEILKVLLYYMDIRREQNIESIVSMLEKIIKREDLQLVDENTLNSIIEGELELFVPSIMLTGLDIIDEQLNNSDEDPFIKIIKHKPLLPVLFKVFYQSKDQELSQLTLQLIFKCFSMRKNLMKSIKNLQLLTDPKEITLYTYLKEQSRTLQFLVEKTEIWLGTPEAINAPGFKYNFVIYQFLDIVKEFTNVMYSSVDVDSFLLINKPIQKHDKDILMSRQNVLKILKIHDTVLELLKGNAFLLKNIQFRTPENLLFFSIFECCFQFLNIFCSINNLDNKKKVYHNIDIIFNYLDIIELGQIDLINTIFKNNQKSNKNLDAKLVKKVINKIIPLKIHLQSDDINESITKSFQKKSQSTLFNAGAQGVQYHPRYLLFLQNIMFYKGEPQRENIKTVVNIFMQGGRFKDFLFLKENEYDQKSYHLNIQIPQLIKTKDKKYEKYRKLGKYVFDLTVVPSQFEFNLPYLYHAQILKMINTFVVNLEDGLKIIIDALQDTITISYLFYLMSKKTIHLEDNLYTLLNFILKIEVIQFIENICLKGFDKDNNFNFKNDEFVNLWIQSERACLANNFQRAEEITVFKDSFEEKLFKLINKGKINPQNNQDKTSFQKQDINSLKNHARPTHKAVNIQVEERILQYIQQSEYKKVEYMVYVFTNLIPFIINIYNFYIMQDKSPIEGNIKALQDFVTQDLKQFISQINPQKLPQMNQLIRKQLKILQNTFKVSFLTLHFQKNDKLQGDIFNEDINSDMNCEQDIQIELVDLPLQNLIYSQSTNCKFQDFAWKCTLINMLLNQTMKVLINSERLTLVKAIQHIQDYKYTETQPVVTVKKVKHIKLAEFLLKTVKYISKEIEQYCKDPLDKNKKLNVVFDCLVLFTDLLNLAKDSSNKKDLEIMQNTLNQSQVLMHCMNFICDQNFTQQNSKMRKFFNIFIQLSNSLLEGGNLEVQNGFYEYFVVNFKSESFFLQIQDKINEERNKKFNKQSIYDKIQSCLKRVEFCYEPFENKDDLKHIVRFLQLLCENHNTQNQNWLRQQTNSRNSIDIMHMITLILKTKLIGDNNNDININMSNFHTIIGCLDFLTEMVQGPCYENQMALSEGSFLDIASLILKENDSVTQRKLFIQSHLYDKDFDDDIEEEDQPKWWQKLLCCPKKGKSTNENQNQIQNSLFQLENEFNQTRLKEQSDKVQTSQILKYFQKTSALYARKFEKQYNNSEIKYLWMVSRTKYKCLITLESLFEGNTSLIQRKRIMQSIPQSYLMINLIWNYENFQEEKKGDYIEELFNITSGTEIDDQYRQQDVLVIQSGFKLLYFLKLYQEDDHFVDQNYQQQEDVEFSSFRFILSGLFYLVKSLGSWSKQKVSSGFEYFQFIGGKHQDVNVHDFDVEEKKDTNEILKIKFQSAYEFYKKNTVHVDILRDNILYETYFPKLPRCDYLTEEIKIKFNSNVDRSSINAKVQYLQDQSIEIIDQLQHEYSQMKQLKSKLRLPVEELPLYFKVLQSLSFFCSFIQNILIIIILGGDDEIPTYRLTGLELAQALYYNQIGASNHVLKMEFGLVQKIATYRKMADLGQFLLRLQQFQIGVAFFLGVYVLYKVYPLQRFKYRKQVRKLYLSKKPLWKQNIYQILIFITHFIIAAEINYYQAYILFSILGYFNPLFSAVLLLDIFKRFPVARQIVMAVKKPYDNILVTLIIFIIFSYFFTLILYFNYWKTVTDNQGNQVCAQLLSCFIFVIDQTFKQNAGFTSYYANVDFSVRVFFDFAYVFIVVILITQVIAGIIIDTFASLRQEDKDKKNDQNNICLICGYDRQTFDRLNDKRGFKQHVILDHNPYYYIFYICYIFHKSETELTGIESYVRQCLNDDDIQWFPMHRTKGLDHGQIINELQRDQSNNGTKNQVNGEDLEQTQADIFRQVEDMNTKLNSMKITIEQATLNLNEKVSEIIVSNKKIEQYTQQADKVTYKLDKVENKIDNQFK